MRELDTFSRGFLITASVVVVIAGLMAAKAIVVPFLLAAFITILTAPFMFRLEKKGVHKGISIVLILILILLIATFFMLLVGTSVNEFYSKAPIYQQKFQEVLKDAILFAKGYGIELNEASLNTVADFSSIFDQIVALLKNFGSLLSYSLMIMLLIAFMLIEASVLPTKLAAIDHRLLEPAEQFIFGVNKYMAIKTVISFFTGLTAYIFLAFMGIDFAIIWAVLTFVFNFIPTIGSIVAAIPPALVALIQIGLWGSVEIMAGYFVINTLFGSILDPRLMGKGLDISILVVFVSVIIWGWILGPIGAFLAVPLTNMIKIALQTQRETKWLAILLGSGKNIEPTALIEKKAD